MNNSILETGVNTINGDADITVVLNFIKHINNRENYDRLIQSSIELIENRVFEWMTQLRASISIAFSALLFCNALHPDHVIYRPVDNEQK